MKNNGIVFDFDGVIINSHNAQVNALKTAFQKVCGYGEPPYEKFFLNSGDSLKNIFHKLGLPMEMIPIYKQVSKSNIQLINAYDGMIELIKELKELGYRCGLCTGKDRERTTEILDYLNIKSLFDAIVCSDDVIKPKPDSESLLKVINGMNVKKENTAMVGDGINDVLCAKNAQITSIAVTWGDVAEKNIALSKPDCIVKSVDSLKHEIIRLLG